MPWPPDSNKLLQVNRGRRLEQDAFCVLFRLGEGEFHARGKSLVVGKMMIRWEEIFNSLRIDRMNIRQAERDGRRSTVVMRLY